LLRALGLYLRALSNGINAIVAPQPILAGSHARILYAHLAK
jgi:hypothetical protein